MLPLARAGLTAPAVVGRGLSEGLGLAFVLLSNFGERCSPQLAPRAHGTDLSKLRGGLRDVVACLGRTSEAEPKLDGLVSELNAAAAVVPRHLRCDFMGRPLEELEGLAFLDGFAQARLLQKQTASLLSWNGHALPVADATNDKAPELRRSSPGMLLIPRSSQASVRRRVIGEWECGDVNCEA